MFAQCHGVDPGWNEVMVGSKVEKYPGKDKLKGSVQRCSVGRFYHEAHYTTSTQKANHWQSQDSTYADIISHMPSIKSCDPASFQVTASAVNTL